MHRCLRGVPRRTVVLAAFVLAFGAQVRADPVPIGDFFKLPDFFDLVVSPSGKRMSAIVPGANGRLQLAVLDMQDLSKWSIVAAYENADIVDPEWVNDERLVYRTFDGQEALRQQRGAGLFSVDAQRSSVPRMLIRPQYQDVVGATHMSSRALDPDTVLRSVLRDGTDDVIVSRATFNAMREVQSVNLLRLDTATGLVRSISQGAPDGAAEWTLDHQGRPRAVLTAKGDAEVLYWKPEASADWVKVEEVPIFSSGHTVEPIYVDKDNHLYAMANVGAGVDTSSLVQIDMAAGIKKRRAILSADGYDFEGSLVLDHDGAVLGVHYLTDARATYWFDAGLKKIQEQVDTLLPGTTNRIDCGDCSSRGRILVTSTSDRQPAVYRMFDTATGAISPIAQSRPWIKAKTMAERDMVRISARDGLSMPVHVTRPIGQKGPAPTVVLVHGGPWLRGGEWEWYPESQFLASRGYVVIEPEFRGSTGFGFNYFRAGWKQWGLAMQDDVADAALWAIKQGYADPKRVCIAGASYGGYAALMGLIRNPEIFRCGFEWVGVTDIELMYSVNWSDSSSQWQRYGMPQLIGDRTADAAQLAASSPLKLADKVTQPLLMAYGGVDVRVPIVHGIEFRDAVRKTNPQVEWIVYSDEGHGWTLPANHVDFWGHVERFLDKNLKNAP